MKYDIRELHSIIGRYGVPGLIVCRAPRIAEIVDKTDGRLLKINEWWLNIVPLWIEQIPERGGAFLSTYSLGEADLMQRAIEEKGISVRRFEPDNMPISELTIGSGNNRMGADRVILTVQT